METNNHHNSINPTCTLMKVKESDTWLGKISSSQETPTLIIAKAGLKDLIVIA
jgi:hypothetical protein